MSLKVISSILLVISMGTAEIIDGRYLYLDGSTKINGNFYTHLICNTQIGGENGTSILFYKNDEREYGEEMYNQRFSREVLKELLKSLQENRITVLRDSIKTAPKDVLDSLKNSLRKLQEGRLYLLERKDVHNDLLELFTKWSNMREDKLGESVDIYNLKRHHKLFLEIWLVAELSGGDDLLLKIVNLLIERYHPELLQEKESQPLIPASKRIITPFFFTAQSFSPSNTQIENTVNIGRGSLLDVDKKIIEYHHFDSYLIEKGYFKEVVVSTDFLKTFQTFGSLYFDPRLDYYALCKKDSVVQWVSVNELKLSLSFEIYYSDDPALGPVCNLNVSHLTDRKVLLYAGLPSPIKPKGYVVLFNRKDTIFNRKNTVFNSENEGTSLRNVNDTIIENQPVPIKDKFIKSFSLYNVGDSSSFSITLHNGKSNTLYEKSVCDECSRTKILNVYLSDVNGDGLWDIICYSTYGGTELFIQLPYGGYEKRIIEFHYEMTH